MVQTYVKQLIASALHDLQAEFNLPAFSIDTISVERPAEETHGDIATPVAMMIAKKEGRNPKEIARKIAQKLLKDNHIKTAEVAGPGFVNVSFTPLFWQKELAVILELKERYGTSDETRGSASVEFISVNPTGELHVAHGRGAFYGDALSRVLQAAGYDVLREFYVNASHHSAQIEEFGRAIKGEGDQYKGPIVEELRTTIDAGGNAMEVGFRAAQVMQERNRKFITEILGISFDEWVWEEQLYEDGLVDGARKNLEKKGLLEERDGAIWFVPEGLIIGDEEGTVVVRSDGSPTYLLPDIAYHRMKNDRGPDYIIDVFGADHQGHEEKLYAVARVFGFRKKMEVVITQMVQLLEGGEAKKMSKRAGTAVPLRWLVEEVGVDAVRFLFLMKSVNTHMEFDLVKAKEQSSNNPVYYVQYAHTRCASLLRKAGEKGIEARSDISALTEDAELALIKKLSAFPEVVELAAQTREVHRIPHYLISLADAFHSFYHDEQIIGDDVDQTKARLALIQATKRVLANGLALLGVSAPETM